MIDPLQTESEHLLEMLLEAANQGDKQAQGWLNRIKQHGATKGLVRDLNKELEGIPMNAVFALNEDSKRLEPRFGFPNLPENVDTRIAFAVATLLSEGALDGLMRCASQDCRKFAVRSTRAKWCSDTCGGRDRGRQKRWKDRERQML